MTVLYETRTVRGACCVDCPWFITGDQMIEATAQLHANRHDHRVEVEYDLVEFRAPAAAEEGEG